MAELQPMAELQSTMVLLPQCLSQKERDDEFSE
jgi:hypothetical protein